jgi:hypothetical protein
VTVDELMREALRLGASERASIAHELLSSLESLSESEIERLWLEEAVRRRTEIESGEASLVSADEALARARARLR